MHGHLIIDDEAHMLVIHPGFRFADGRSIALIKGRDGVVLHVGEACFPVEVARQGDRLWVHLDGRAHEIVWCDPVDHYAEEADQASDGVERAPMPGAVVNVAVAPGDAVKAGDVLLVIESMKLETSIRAAIDGTVEAVHVVLGQSFERDALLATVVAEG